MRVNFQQVDGPVLELGLSDVVQRLSRLAGFIGQVERGALLGLQGDDQHKGFLLLLQAVTWHKADGSLVIVST